MRIGSRAVVLAFAAALLVAPLTGCTTLKVTVRLPGFANGSVDGLWFWRLEGGSYKRKCRINLSNPFVSGGREVVNYTQSCVGGGATSAPWQAVVQRQSSNPTTVTLVLVYRRGGSAAAPHRASAFNTSGESALSTASLSI